MPPEQAGEILADAVAKKIDLAENKHDQLALTRANLNDRTKKILEIIENRQIEIADAEDHDSPIAKTEENRLRSEIMLILEILSKKRRDDDKKIKQTEEQLQAMETRIQSLESLFPGQEENN